MKKAKEAAVQYQTAVKKAATKSEATAPVTAAPTTTVPISVELLEQLQQAAEWEGITLEEVTDAAMSDYYYRYASAKIKKEQAIFEQRKPELLKRYRGQYIALHNGEVVAHAPNLSALHQKVLARFGHTPILHKQVLPEPDREYVIRSPRLERP